MKLTDFVYGEEEVNEKILIDLINSKELQRLKGIAQFGLPSKYYHKKGYSRYEHSIGVLILLRRLKTNLKEQIAGLIHDISHTAFSHVIDWVIGDSRKEDYQDNSFPNFIKNSSIPFILKIYGFDYKEFLDLEKFSLLEQPIPSLCADRFDYAIREIKNFEKPENTKLIINNLRNFNGRLVFYSKKVAELFAKGYIKCQNEHWASNEAKARFHILAKILKRALDQKIISFEDLKNTDEHVINILEKSEDGEILDGLNFLKNGFKIVEANEGLKLVKKFRYVDPEILFDREIKMLSDISENYKKVLENEKRNANNIRKIKIIDLNLREE